MFDTLQSTFGALYVNDFNRSGRVYQVQLQSEPRFRAYPEDIRNVYVRAKSGELVPLTALATIREVTGPEIVERFNVFTSAKSHGQRGAGLQLGRCDATRSKKSRAKSLPRGYQLAWTGTAYQEKVSGGASNGVYLLGVLMVFLILAAQFERWTLPLAVILAVPFAAFGALLAVFLRGLENDIYFQIGMLTLVGLAAKNAILIVEFAMMKYHEGMPLAQAAVEGAKLRFRPIIMTSLRADLRRAAARDQHGRRRGEPSLARHQRHRRHAGGDVHRDVLRAAVLPLDRGLGSMRAQASRRAARWTEVSEANV